MKKSIAFLLVIALSLSILVTPISAAYNTSSNNTSEVYVSEELNTLFTRLITDEKVTVTYESLDGNERHVVVNDNGQLYIDGCLIETFAVSKIAPPTGMIGERFYADSDINWGDFSEKEYKINTGGKPLETIAAMIGVLIPGVGMGLILQLINTSVEKFAGAADYILLTHRVRFGSDNDYTYFEEYIDIVDDKGNVWVDNARVRYMKEPLYGASSFLVTRWLALA